MASKAAGGDGRRGQAGAPLDVAIVGAGFAGMYTMHRAQVRGLNAMLFEAGTSVGGTWYWNRYPGARVDLESMEYSFTFDEKLQQEWSWTERYAGQPELLAYANHFADRFDLRRNLLLSSRITAAHFDEACQLWRISTQQGDRYEARFLVMATGFLSDPNLTLFNTAEQYKGGKYVTGRWPHEAIDFSGQKVAVIGTGSSAVQAIPEIAKQAKHLTVFQRTPAYTIPSRNKPMDAEFERYIKGMYPELRRMQREAFAGFCLVNSKPNPQTDKLAMDVSEQERTAEFERRWQSGGLCMYTAFLDLLTDERANKACADFVNAKNRQRVRDPAVADLLTPKNYPILTKRLCADAGYHETYNRDNVQLVDVNAHPLEGFNQRGMQVGGQQRDFDSIVFATGFDAGTGGLTRMDLRGRGGKLMREHWADGITTYLTLGCTGFPNLFFVDGPASLGAFFHPILLSEFQGDYVLDIVQYMMRNQLGTIEPVQEQEDRWVAHTAEVADGTLFKSTKSWYFGTNIPGKPRRMLSYLGGFAAFKQWCSEAAANDYGAFRIEGLTDEARRAGMATAPAAAAAAL